MSKYRSSLTRLYSAFPHQSAWVMSTIFVSHKATGVPAEAPAHPMLLAFLSAGVRPVQSTRCYRRGSLRHRRGPPRAVAVRPAVRFMALQSISSSIESATLAFSVPWLLTEALRIWALWWPSRVKIKKEHGVVLRNGCILVKTYFKTERWGGGWKKHAWAVSWGDFSWRSTSSWLLW